MKKSKIVTVTMSLVVVLLAVIVLTMIFTVREQYSLLMLIPIIVVSLLLMLTACVLCDKYIDAHHMINKIGVNREKELDEREKSINEEFASLTEYRHDLDATIELYRALYNNVDIDIEKMSINDIKALRVTLISNN